jgi:uncharacterized membrane protein
MTYSSHELKQFEFEMMGETWKIIEANLIHDMNGYYLTIINNENEHFIVPISLGNALKLSRNQLDIKILVTDEIKQYYLLKAIKEIE